jgi:hypothetical protein
VLEARRQREHLALPRPQRVPQHDGVVVVVIVTVDGLELEVERQTHRRRGPVPRKLWANPAAMKQIEPGGDGAALLAQLLGAAAARVVEDLVEGVAVRAGAVGLAGVLVPAHAQHAHRPAPHLPGQPARPGGATRAASRRRRP